LNEFETKLGMEEEQDNCLVVVLKEEVTEDLKVWIDDNGSVNEDTKAWEESLMKNHEDNLYSSEVVQDEEEIKYPIQELTSGTAKVLETSKIPSKKSKVTTAQTVRSNSTTEKYQCGKCVQIFNKPETYKRHLVRWHRSDRRFTFGCDFCSKRFATIPSLQFHFKKLHKKSSTPFACYQCSDRFTRKVELRQHIKTERNLCSNLEAEQEKEFKDLESSTREMNRVDESDLRRAKFRCKICKEIFAKEKYLTKHLKTHMEKKPILRAVVNECHKCSYCRKTFNSKSNLARHEDLAHSTRKLKEKAKEELLLKQVESLEGGNVDSSCNSEVPLFYVNQEGGAADPKNEEDVILGLPWYSGDVIKVGMELMQQNKRLNVRR